MKRRLKNTIHVVTEKSMMSSKFKQSVNLRKAN